MAACEALQPWIGTQGHRGPWANTAKATAKFTIDFISLKTEP